MLDAPTVHQHRCQEYEIVFGLDSNHCLVE